MNKHCKIISYFYDEDETELKCTNIVELAQAFAENDKRVLVIKRNYFSNSYSLYDKIEHTKHVEAVNAFSLGTKNVWMVDDDEISEESSVNQMDLLIFTNEIMSMNYSQVNNITGRIYASIMKTACAYNIDYVVVELFLPWSALTRSLLFSSHYIVACGCYDSSGLRFIKTLKRHLVTDTQHMHSLNIFNNKQNSLFKMPPFPKYIGFMVNKERKENSLVNKFKYEFFKAAILDESKELAILLKENRVSRNKFYANKINHDLYGNDMYEVRDLILSNIKICSEL